jgi:hypothetical protein
MGLEGGEKSYGIRLTGDGSGVAGMLESTAKAAEKTEKQLERTGDATQSSAQQSKNFAEALKQQTGALGDTSKALDKFEELTGRRIPSALRGLVASGGLAALAVGALGYAAYSAIAQHVAFERQLTRTEVALAAQGRGAALSRERMADLTREVARLPGVSADMAGQVVESISRVRSVGGAQMAELAKLTTDWAAASGEDAPAAMRKLAAAIGDPARGVKTLQQEYGLLNAEQLMSIDRMLAYGQTSEAQGVLIDALKTRLEGLADKGLSPVARLWERIKAAAQPALEAMGNEVPETSYLGSPVPRAFAGDSRGADNAAMAGYQNTAYSLAQQYAPELARRQQLTGARSQLEDSIAYGGLNPAQLEAARAALANIDAEIGKSTDGLQRYLTVAMKMNEAAQESVYGTHSRTAAEVALVQIEELYASGQVKGTAATMERIRATLQAASASEQLAIDRQREMASDQAYLAAKQAIQDQQDEATRRFMVAGRTRVQELELETDLITRQSARESEAAQVSNNRYQQIEIQTRLQVENNAAREKAIAFRRLELDFQAASIGKTEEEIAALSRALEARKQMLGEAIDEHAAAQGARDAAQAVRQEWESQQRNLASSVQGTLTHALVTAFLDGGRSGGEALKAALKSTMATLILEPLIRPIMMPIANFASQASMSLFGQIGSSFGLSSVGSAAGAGVGSSALGAGVTGLGAGIAGWFAKMGGGGSALQLGGPGAGAVTYTNAGGASAASSGAAAGTGFGLLALGDIMSAQNGRDWTRTLYGGMPPMAGRISQKLGVPEFFIDPVGAVFGHDAGDAMRTGNFAAGFGQAGGSTSNQWFSGAEMGASLAQFSQQMAAQEQTIITNLHLSAQQIAQVNDSLAQLAGRSYAFGVEHTDWTQSGAGQSIQGDRLAAIAAALGLSVDDLSLPSLQSLQGGRAGLTAQLRSVIGADSLEQFRDSLKVSDLSTGGPLDQLESARSLFQRDYEAVHGGDFARMGSFLQESQQYLNIGRSVYASGPAYADLYNQVQSALDSVGAAQNDILKDLPGVMMQNTQDEIAAVKQQTGEIVAALKDVSSKIDRLRAAGIT